MKHIFLSLITVVALGLVGSENNAFGRFSNEKSTSLKDSDWRINKNVLVCNVCPHENAAISSDSLLEILQRDKDETATSLRARTQGVGRLVSKSLNANRKIWLEAGSIPFSGSPTLYASSWRGAKIFPNNGNIGAGYHVRFPFFLLDGTKAKEGLHCNISPQLNAGLIPDCFVSLVQKIGANDGGNGQNDSRKAQDYRPTGYGPIVASIFWITAFCIGVVGLWIGIFRHDSATIFGLSLIVAMAVALIGAIVL
jgi:hypothetical protein